jgi:hypothetical protein
MQQFVIDRSKWRTGGADFNHKYGDTLLLNSKGFMCCLGFFCNQIENRTTDEILFVPNPSQLDDNIRGSNLIGDDGYNKPWVETAISINDDDYISNEAREERIHKLFKNNGYDLKFINQYPE